ncbi:hypothetical protein [Chroococcidiopsis cubana]|nr:hypothetical protein [Chroococcidiopsis cubana]
MKSQNFFTDRSRLPSTGAQHPLSTPDSLVRAYSIPYRLPTP